MIYSDVLPGGKHWSMTMRRTQRLRLTDVEGGANVGMLFYNPVNLLERYNAPDTLKCQHTFKLTAGHCLYSDMGRIFCSIVADSHGCRAGSAAGGREAPDAQSPGALRDGGVAVGGPAGRRAGIPGGPGPDVQARALSETGRMER
jgi:uncharacterized protein YcgI (DUF1989 family)